MFTNPDTVDPAVVRNALSAFGLTTDPEDKRMPNEKYDAALKQIADMGFTD
jgi:hypothetical protein